VSLVSFASIVVVGQAFSVRRAVLVCSAKVVNVGLELFNVHFLS